MLGLARLVVSLLVLVTSGCLGALFVLDFGCDVEHLPKSFVFLIMVLVLTLTNDNVSLDRLPGWNLHHVRHRCFATSVCLDLLDALVLTQVLALESQLDGGGGGGGSDVVVGSSGGGGGDGGGGCVRGARSSSSSSSISCNGGSGGGGSGDSDFRSASVLVDFAICDGTGADVKQGMIHARVILVFIVSDAPNVLGLCKQPIAIPAVDVDKVL